MDVRLPDGTIIKDVPDNITKAELTEKLARNGYDVAKLPASSKPAADDGALGMVKKAAGMGYLGPMGMFATEEGRDNLKNMAAGAVRGAGSIGATILSPLDKAQDMYYGDRGPKLSGQITGKQPLSRNEERRQAMGAGLQSLVGADPSSFAYGAGKLGTEIAGTFPIGGLVGGAVKSASAAPAVQALGNAIATGGMKAGTTPGLMNMATRMAGGAVNGGITAGLINPEDATLGAGIGAALPPSLTALGKAGSAIGSKLAGPAVADDLVKAADSAIGAGYVIPPTQVKPSLKNRLLEGFAGKITTAQNASAKNQAVTNDLVRKDLGIAADEKITTEVLDSIRAKAGEAYKDIASLGKFDATTAKLPASVKMQETLNPMGTLSGGPSKLKTVDAQDLIKEWKQANHDATAYYRAYQRDANPETLAKAKSAASAAKDIDDFLLSKLKDIGAEDKRQALLEARKLIAKTYTAENALNATSGNIDAGKLAAAIQKGKPVSGNMKTAGEFAGRFPKAAQVTEKMGSLPQVSPLDFGTFGALSAVMANPAMMAGVLARPAARATVLSGPVQRGLLSSQQPSALSGLLSDPALESLVYRSAPAIAGRR